MILLDFWKRILVASLLVMALFIFSPNIGWSSDLNPAVHLDPIIVYTRISPGPDEDGPGRLLIEKVQNNETIRIIVGIDFDMVAPHELSESDASSQANDMSRVQKAVLDRVFIESDEDRSSWQFSHIPFMTLEVDREQLRKILLDPLVVSVQEDVVTQPMLDSSVSLIKAQQLWNMNPKYRGNGQVIAILDTGTNHEVMLKNRIVAGACFSSNYSYYPSESLCRNKSSSEIGLSAGSNCPTTVGGCDHGTHVATIAAGDNGSLRGVARESGIIRVQVFSKFTDSYWCGGYAPCVMSYGSDQIRGLEHVYSLRNSFQIAAVNMSLGGGYYSSACDNRSPAISSIINQLTSAGTAVVIAAGNNGLDGYISYPACIANAVAVGSSTKFDNVSSFSNHSPLIDLLAPGDAIMAGTPSRSYRRMSGTSMAAPHVAGAFALLKSFEVNATVGEIQTALQCTGEPVSRSGTSRNRIDLRSAYQFLKKGVSGCKKNEDSSTPDWVPRHGWF